MDKYLLGLSNTMDTAHGLCLQDRVDERLADKHMGRREQGQSSRLRLGMEHKHMLVGIVLEFLDGRAGRRSIQTYEPDLIVVQTVANEIQKCGPLRKDEALDRGVLSHQIRNVADNAVDLTSEPVPDRHPANDLGDVADMAGRLRHRCF